MSNNEHSAFDILLKRNVPHILEAIFLSLDYVSFKRSLKVSRAWSKVLGTKMFLKRAKSIYAKGIRSDKKTIMEALLKGDAVSASSLLSGLISMGVNIDFSIAYVTPLHRACEKGLKDVVKLLLSAGANPNYARYNNITISSCITDTPLYYAANGGHLDVVKLLLGSGANPNQSAKPLNGAVSGGHLDIIRTLLAAGTDPNKSDDSSLCSVVWSYSSKKRLEIAQLLLDAGADPNKSSRDEENPLARAAAERNLDMVKLLLAAGADPKKCSGARGFGFKNPLNSAAHNGDQDMVRELLRAGADPNEVGDYKTPLIRGFDAFRTITIMSTAIWNISYYNYNTTISR